MLHHSKGTRAKLAFTSYQEEGNDSVRIEREEFTVSTILAVFLIAILVAALASCYLFGPRIRTQLATVKSDLAQLAVAVEAYKVDNGTYPNDTEYGWPWYPTYNLTTPIPYISAERFIDPFRRVGERNPTPHKYWRFYRFINYPANNPEHRWKNLPNDYMRVNISAEKCLAGMKKYGEWRLSSTGPDGYESGDLWGEQDASIADTGPGPWADWFVLCMVYDPTNGTISCGDILRCQKTGEVTSVAAPE
jgi:hypothetical protein